jgi:ribosomal protein S18 acetylase RimI-like enzyme
VAGRGHVPLSELQIRPATTADAPVIATIQVHGHQWAYRGLLPQPLSTDEWIAQRTAVWLRLLASDDGQAFIAERDASAVGFVNVGAPNDPTLPAATGMLFALYLEPDVIGQGVGRALLARAVEELRARGFAEAVLWVLEENARARSFYERAGWSFDGTRKDYERDGAARHELRYRRTL